jgi:acyl-CoA thioesterase FadM
MMLKRCAIEWDGSVGPGDRLDINVAVSRWGRTSWDLDFAGSCQGRPVFRARVVYVSVERGTVRAIDTPRLIRDFLGEPVEIASGLGRG